MAEESVFRGVISFMDQIGVYDVILPFLLVFTIFFAILEKTKILGTEKIQGQETTKKNINAIVSFVVSFLVIASTKLVAVINETMANIVLLLVLAISFMLLVGVFFGSKEFTLENFPTWTKFFMILMFIGIVIIFLNALDWLKYISYLLQNWDAQWGASIILLIIVIGFMVYIVRDPKTAKKESKD